jgi:hypothetical protein
MKLTYRAKRIVNFLTDSSLIAGCSFILCGMLIGSVAYIAIGLVISGLTTLVPEMEV